MANRTADRSTGKSRFEIQQDITDRVIAALKEGVVPWQNPWQKTGMRRPLSMATGRTYRGINSWMLGLSASVMASASPYWGTINHVNAQAGKVRKGERSTYAILYAERETNKDREGNILPAGEKQKIMIARWFRLFNAAQCEHLPDRYYPGEPSPQEIAELPGAEWVAAAYLNSDTAPGLVHARGIQAAYYDAEADQITLPPKNQFKSPAKLAATRFHEMAHSTGHKSRLARLPEGGIDHFGSDMYSKEELAAQMAAELLCALTGITTEFDNTVAYIENWLTVLEGDPKFVVQAASQAEKAVALIYPEATEDAGAAGEEE